MDDFSSEGGGTYCASVSSGDDEKATKSELRRTYRCSKCGAEKKGHVCAAKIKEQKEVSASLAVHCFCFIFSSHFAHRRNEGILLQGLLPECKVRAAFRFEQDLVQLLVAAHHLALTLKV
mmetsp:Transcript_20426/g.56466  ORF Transcript_20426/g.56466 Transcript_20426/m.56466 type:complete len:120 (-) Transcript_20426:150-509(-)